MSREFTESLPAIPSEYVPHSLTRAMEQLSVDNWPGIENQARTGGDKLPPRRKTFPDLPGRVLVPGSVLTSDNHILELYYIGRSHGMNCVYSAYREPDTYMPPKIIYKSGINRI